MEVRHRITFGHKHNVEETLGALGIKCKRNPLPGGGYTLRFEIEESDVRWTDVARLVQDKGAVDFYDTHFSLDEIRGSSWARLIPTFEQGYPQPEDTWLADPINHDSCCYQCRVGCRQVAPFRLDKEPRLGKNDYLTLHWTTALFCTHRVIEALESIQIRGYRTTDAIIHRTDTPSNRVVQLLFPHVANPGYIVPDDIQTTYCETCASAKFSYHKRGHMKLKITSIITSVDVQLTQEWFGSGKLAFREILVSNRLINLILDRNFRGVALKPIRLIDNDQKK